MHAVVGIWTQSEDQRDEQSRGLHDEVIPIVKAHPGFVAGYWMHDPVTGKGYTVIMLDNEESAIGFKALVTGRFQRAAQVGITNDLLALTEVDAEARA